MTLRQRHPAAVPTLSVCPIAQWYIPLRGRAFAVNTDLERKI